MMNTMWVKKPQKGFRDVVEDLAPNCTDFTKKKLYVITYDDQQRNFNAPPKYYGIFWSEGPDAVNALAIALWPEFDGYDGSLGDEFKNHRHSDHNIDDPGQSLDNVMMDLHALVMELKQFHLLWKS